MLSNIQRVDIEIHSKCNRKCSWCSNTIVDRQSQDIILDKKIFTDLVQDLYDNNFGLNFAYNSDFYASTISFLGYSEPLLQDKILKEYINIVKNIFTDRDIRIAINTNGDYFTEDKLSNLNASLLNVMDYDCKGREYWSQKLQNNHCVIIENTPNFITAIHRNVNLIQIYLDWPKKSQLENRGGILKIDDEQLKNLSWKNDCSLRKVPCPEPQYCLNIYHNGDVTPCCHIRPDYEGHQEYVMGNIYKDNIIDIFYNKKFTKFKTLLESWDYKSYPEPCKYCQKIREKWFKYIQGFDGPIYINSNLIEKYNLLSKDENPLKYILKIYGEKNNEYYYSLQNNLNNILHTSIDFTVNKQNLREIFKFYYLNIKSLTERYTFDFIEEINSFHLKQKYLLNITMGHSYKELIESYHFKNGFYTPFFNLKNYEEDNNNQTIILEGRSRFVSLQGKILQTAHTNSNPLAINFNQKKLENENNIFYFPNFLIKALPQSDFKVIQTFNNHSKIQIDNDILIFLLSHSYQKFIGDIIDKFKDAELLKTIQYPHSLLNRNMEVK